MNKEFLRNLDVDSLTPEEARKIGIEYLEDSVDEAKFYAKRFGFASVVLSAIYALGTMATSSPIMHGIAGLDAFTISVTAKKLFQLAGERKVLRLMKDNQYNGDYIQFAKDCKNYVIKYESNNNQKAM